MQRVVLHIFRSLQDSHDQTLSHELPGKLVLYEKAHENCISLPRKIVSGNFFP